VALKRSSQTTGTIVEKYKFSIGLQVKMPGALFYAPGESGRKKQYNEEPHHAKSWPYALCAINP
jgi:hypothetical protein